MTTFPCFLVFSRAFPLFLVQLQACPLVTSEESGQKAAFGHKRRLLTAFPQSDEWGRLIWMPRMSFSREKLIFSI